MEESSEFFIETSYMFDYQKVRYTLHCQPNIKHQPWAIQIGVPYFSDMIYLP